MAGLSHLANPWRTLSFHPFEWCLNAEAFVLSPFWPEDSEVAYQLIPYKSFCAIDCAALDGRPSSFLSAMVDGRDKNL
jgi:hypothetical protein